MSTIAFLVMDDRREWQNALHGAFFACCVLSALWLVFAFLGKRKGKPLELSYGFWCLAGPGWLGLVGFLIAIFENRVASIIILLLAVVLPVLSAVTSNQPLRVEIEPATLNCLTRTSFPTNSMPNG